MLIQKIIRDCYRAGCAFTEPEGRRVSEAPYSWTPPSTDDAFAIMTLRTDERYSSAKALKKTATAAMPNLISVFRFHESKRSFKQSGDVHWRIRI